MAVKTPFSTEELQVMLADYELGKYIASKGFELGADQTNLLLVTTMGKYAFRYYEKRSLAYVLFEIDLLQFLGCNHFSCPAPLQRRDRSFVGTYKAKPYAIFSFMEGEHDERRSNYRLVAEIIGKLHVLTVGHKPAYFESRASYGPDYAWACAKANVNNIPSQSEARERLSWFRAELDSLQLPEELPKGVCHGDTNPSNFLYKDGEVSAVLDFDQASYTWLLYDVAQMVYWWTWSNMGDIEFKKARDLVAHYGSVRQLEAEEKRHLFDVLKLVHLIGIGWSFADESFDNDKRKVVDLNEINRKRFYKEFFV
jgi:homoserine kinase type II